MSRKKGSPPQFSVGEEVRVRQGVVDPDFSDLPLGGWIGEVVEIEPGSPPTYLVRWDSKTLSSIHPVFRKRCQRDGFDIEQMWLDETDLEPAVGESIQVERPAEIVTRPLSMDDQDDRIRAVFGITSDDPLPEVDERTLTVYYRYVSSLLTFPFSAAWTQEGESLSEQTPKVTVLGLGDAEHPLIDDHSGILCEARQDGSIVHLPLAELEVGTPGAIRQAVDDYSYWFWNWS